MHTNKYLVYTKTTPYNTAHTQALVFTFFPRNKWKKETFLITELCRLVHMIHIIQEHAYAL